MAETIEGEEDYSKDNQGGIRLAIQNMVTRDDNTTHDLTLFGTAIGLLTIIILQIYITYKTGVFDSTTFTMSYTGLLWGSNAGIATRVLSESKAASMFSPTQHH